LPYPRSLTFENRDDFRAHRESDHSMLIGEQHLGTFGLSWRRSSSTGEFDGVIGIEIGVEYFENFFRGLDTTGHQRAVLVRADGTVLAASPGTGEPKRFPPASKLMQSIASGVQNQEWNVTPNGITHFFRWRQLDPYPVYVAYAVDEEVALRAWYWRIAFYAILRCRCLGRAVPDHPFSVTARGSGGSFAAGPEDGGHRSARQRRSA
jgi:hypothetical protein